MEVSVVCRVLHENMQGKLSWREKWEDVEEEEEASREDGSPEMMVLRENSSTQESATRVSRVSQREAMTFWSREESDWTLNTLLSQSHMTFGNQAPRVWRRSSGRTDRQTIRAASSAAWGFHSPCWFKAPCSSQSQSGRPAASRLYSISCMCLSVFCFLQTVSLFLQQDQAPARSAFWLMDRANGIAVFDCWTVRSWTPQRGSSRVR